MRFMSRVLPAIGILLSTIAVAGCGGSGTTGNAGAASSQSAPVVPQVVTVSPSERYMFVPASSSTAVPAGTPPIVNAWVSLSGAITGMPCVSCAGSPPRAGSLGVSFPAPYHSHTGAYHITYTFFNVSKGSAACTLAFDLTQGSTSLLHHVFNINLNGNGQYVYFIQGTMPSTAVPGAAKSSAKLTCGTLAVPVASQQDYLF